MNQGNRNKVNYHGRGHSVNGVVTELEQQNTGGRVKNFLEETTGGAASCELMDMPELEGRQV